MSTLNLFRSNDWPTLGVEIELQLVDERSMALTSVINAILTALPETLSDFVKPEFMQCYVEINTDVRHTVAEVEADLAGKVRTIEAIAGRQGVRLVWAATHPFSPWQDQRITPNARYFQLAESLQETVIRPVTFGLHVHVGVGSGDQAMWISNRLMPHLPLLLALSANSPFWHGRLTGHHAHRIEMLESFPTGGLPPLWHGWDDYTRLVDDMIASGFIESPKELWWDIRPNPGNGTIEVRVCDMPPDLPSVLGLSALLQCLVHDLSHGLNSGDEAPDYPPHWVRQNRWRACRYGLGAALVEPRTHQATPARQVAEALVQRLWGTSQELGCTRDLERVLEMAASPTGAERQMALAEETGSLTAVVQEMVRRSSLAQSNGQALTDHRWVDGEPAARPGDDTAAVPPTAVN